MTMAKAADGSGTEATTLIFPKKSDWDALSEAKRTAKKRASSANGTFSKELARLVEQCHMDRRASRIVLALDAIEDDGDLHVTVFHLVDGLKKLDILKRAMAQEEMFNDHKIDDAALTRASTKGARAGKGAKDDGQSGGRGGGLKLVGEAARQVAEAAGAEK
jgi:hypothetical protein